MAEENAYIGYRSAGRRPESQQDRRSAADAPLSALRGFASGVLGAPGDIEALIRMLPGLSERTALPTSGDIEKRLPLPELSTTPTGRAFTAAGQLGGGFYGGPGSPLKVIAESPRIIGRAARDFAQSVSPVHVIKPKGGNWLAGSVERAIAPMKQTELGMPTAEDLAGISNDPRVLAELDRRRSGAAMNRWLEQKLSKYIRNEMATPEDPLRALAERGVTMENPEAYAAGANWVPETMPGVRKSAGFPAEGMGVSDVGKGWEISADTVITPEKAGDLLRLYPHELEKNPWLAKVPPDTAVYSADLSSGDRGFSHLTDELRNAINPESGLPANLLWKYQDLDKVTVPQAVQRVHDINEWRAAQKAEADMARAMNPATHVFKEYPEQGMSWVELRAPDELSEEALKAFEGDTRIKKSLGDVPSERARKLALEDALKYEGETMGHCVGGYCPDVVEGRSKIYSLRDKKGQPHVTIEVRPGKVHSTGGVDSLPESDYDRVVALADELSEKRLPGGVTTAGDIEAAYLKLFPPPLPEIIQIKGKANRAPNAEYLPAVQDFVRSGNFGKIGDLGNTGLIDVTQAGPLMKALQDIYGRDMGIGMDKFNAAADATPDAQRFMTKDELLKFLGETPPEGFARGGQVRGYAEGGVVSKIDDPARGYDWQAIADAARVAGLSVPSFMSRNWDKIMRGMYNLAPVVVTPTALPTATQTQTIPTASGGGDSMGLNTGLSGAQSGLTGLSISGMQGLANQAMTDVAQMALGSVVNAFSTPNTQDQMDAISVVDMGPTSQGTTVGHGISGTTSAMSGGFGDTASGPSSVGPSADSNAVGVADSASESSGGDGIGGTGTGVGDGGAAGGATAGDGSGPGSGDGDGGYAKGGQIKLKNLAKKYAKSPIIKKAKFFAGGQVSGANFPTDDFDPAETTASSLVEYNPAKIQSLVDSLREEMYG